MVGEEHAHTEKKLYHHRRKECLLFQRPFGRCYACIYFDTVKISRLLKDKVTSQKAVWTAANALPADSGHVITQR